MKILVEVEGGAVQRVFCDEPGAQVIVRDFDNIESGDEDPLETKPELWFLKNPKYEVY